MTYIPHATVSDDEWRAAYHRFLEPPPLEVVVTPERLSATLTMSTEAAMEYGLVPDTRPPAPRRHQARWRLRDRIGRVRRRVGFWIAGVLEGADEDRLW